MANLIQPLNNGNEKYGYIKKGMVCGFWYEKRPHRFYYNLVEEMIDNYYKRNVPTTRRGGILQTRAPPTFYPITHEKPTPINRRKKYVT